MLAAIAALPDCVSTDIVDCAVDIMYIQDPWKKRPIFLQ